MTGKSMTSQAATEAGKQPASLLKTALAALLLTLVCGGAGFLAGHQNSKSENGTASDAVNITQAKPADISPLKLLQLPAVITNLSGGAKWIRLESSALIETVEDIPPALPAQLAEDIATFARTISLEQMSAPSGFQHFREELLERLATRTGGKIKDLTFQSIVIE